MVGSPSGPSSPSVVGLGDLSSDGCARRSRVAIASICDCECGGRRVAFGRVAAVGRNRVRKLLLCLGSGETKVETRGWRILDATRSFGPEQLLKNVAARRKIKSKFAFMY